MKKIIVTGNVGRDPEMRSDAEGNQFATFSMAISVGTKQNPKTDWVDISCNGKLADTVCNYVRKGSKLLIEGFPTVGAYISRDNKPVGTLRIFANNMEFIGSKRDEMSESGSDSSDNVYTLPESNMNVNNFSNNPTNSSLKGDDIPF